MMFVEGGDPLDVPVESLTVIPACDSERREGEGWEPLRLGQQEELPACTLHPRKPEGWGGHSWPIPRRVLS